MTVTSLFVELVVGGLHTLLWIALAILAFTGYQSIDWEKLAGLNWVIPVLAIAYILGIVMDRLADLIFMGRESKVRDLYRDKEQPKYLFIRYTVLMKSKEIYEQLEYTRSRLRIARTAIVNFGLTTLAALLFIVLQLGITLGSNLIIVCISTAVSGVVITYLTYQAYIGLAKNYYLSAMIAYDAVQQNDMNDANAKKSS